MNDRLQAHAGDFQLGIGALHLTYGLAKYRRPLAAIARRRAVSTEQEEQTAFWFMALGLATLASGQTTRWAQRQTGTLPASAGWTTLGIGLLGAALIPRSGFWFIIPQGLLALRASRER